MTGTSPDSIQQLPDTTNVLPSLSEAKAPVTISLTIDKSVSKIAAWVVGVIMGCALLIGAGIVLAVLMVIEWRDAQMEARVQTQEVIYLQAAILAHGIPIPHPPGNDVEKPKEE